MKIRNGFVSNSSASSFIVHYYSNWYSKNKKVLLDKKTIEKLLNYGFKETRLSHPSHLDNADLNDKKTWKAETDKDGTIISKNYGYWVSCNEVDVIQWLVKNDIGFIASGHYGHDVYLFHKGDKHLMVFKNYGAVVETYHQEDKWEDIVKNWKQFKLEEPFYRVLIKDVMKW